MWISMAVSSTRELVGAAADLDVLAALHLDRALDRGGPRSELDDQVARFQGDLLLAFDFDDLSSELDLLVGMKLGETRANRRLLRRHAHVFFRLAKNHPAHRVDEELRRGLHERSFRRERQFEPAYDFGEDIVRALH